MSTRISSAILLLLLAGCGSHKDDQAGLANVEAQQRAAADDSGQIECAVGGQGAFARACTVDREESDQGLILTVRNPDGGFHRLLVTKDGRGVIAADGAQPAQVAIEDADHIAVTIGSDRYRLPATVKGSKPAKS
jgi:hypothetical protein